MTNLDYNDSGESLRSVLLNRIACINSFDEAIQWDATMGSWYAFVEPPKSCSDMTTNGDSSHDMQSSVDFCNQSMEQNPNRCWYGFPVHRRARQLWRVNQPKFGDVFFKRSRRLISIVGCIIKDSRERNGDDGSGTCRCDRNRPHNWIIERRRRKISRP